MPKFLEFKWSAARVTSTWVRIIQYANCFKLKKFPYVVEVIHNNWNNMLSKFAIIVLYISLKDCTIQKSIFRNHFRRNGFFFKLVECWIKIQFEISVLLKRFFAFAVNILRKMLRYLLQRTSKCTRHSDTNQHWYAVLFILNWCSFRKLFVAFLLRFGDTCSPCLHPLRLSLCRTFSKFSQENGWYLFSVNKHSVYN